jgi:uncharacterized protein (TIGR02757 family)
VGRAEGGAEGAVWAIRAGWAQAMAAKSRHGENASVSRPRRVTRGSLTGAFAPPPATDLDFQRRTLDMGRLEWDAMPLRKRIDELEAIYRQFNRRELASHDPIVFLYEYDDPDDREVAAVVASSLAYGRVAQILASVRTVLARLEPRPARFLHDSTDSRLLRVLAGFKHRFTTGQDLSSLLSAVRDVRRGCGSLRKCFLAGRSDAAAQEAADRLVAAPGAATRDRRQTYLPELTHLCETLRAARGGHAKFLLPSPLGGSACKRLNLMLRWLIRHDEVDPGGWEGVESRGLLIPLDTHMRRMAQAMGATARKAADLKTVLEVTAAFRTVREDDPVRYDFALTRRGILGTKGTGKKGTGSVFAVQKTVPVPFLSGGYSERKRERR